jgi:dCMP deaminase
MNIFSKIVSVTAERSSCERLRVWCLLVKDNRIISQGYNGYLPGCVHESIVRNNHEQATVHADKTLYVIVQKGS